MSRQEPEEMTFWDHLDELRKILFRIGILVTFFSVLAFLCKETLFEIVLAPRSSDFILYRWLNDMGTWLNMPSLHIDDFSIQLISIQLTSQFFIHMSMAFYAGILLASPYIIYSLFCFVSPALYAHERKVSAKVLVSAFFLFTAGILLSYFLVFPISFHFLATYQVSDVVANTISLSSYIDTFVILSLMLGASFEIPVLAYFFARLGLITSGFLRKYRRHAMVTILIIGAIITPTSDIFTLMLVSIPIYMLYEASILIVARTQKRDA